MWCECGGGMSSLLFRPQLRLAAGQNRYSARLNVRFFIYLFLQACAWQHKLTRTSLMFGTSNANVPVYTSLLTREQFIGKMFIWKSIAARAKWLQSIKPCPRFSNTQHVSLLQVGGAGRCFLPPCPLLLSFFHPTYILSFYTFSIMRKQIADKAIKDLVMTTRMNTCKTNFFVSVNGRDKSSEMNGESCDLPKYIRFIHFLNISMCLFVFCYSKKMV